jgi:hypothetical protein
VRSGSGRDAWLGGCMFGGIDPFYVRGACRFKHIFLFEVCGKSNAEIGMILGISSATVGKHLEHIYPKLGVENRSAAASFIPR